MSAVDVVLAVAVVVLAALTLDERRRHGALVDRMLADNQRARHAESTERGRLLDAALRRTPPGELPPPAAPSPPVTAEDYEAERDELLRGMGYEPDDVPRLPVGL